MSRAPRLRGALWVALLGPTCSLGCIHNHYYGTVPGAIGCPPVGTTVTTQLGSVCDVPSGLVVVSNPSNSAPVVSSTVTPPTKSTPATGQLPNGSSRVVINQPAYGPPSIGQGTSRFRWKSLDPDAPPPMKAEGGFDGSTLR